jgi:hypothetical protein
MQSLEAFIHDENLSLFRRLLADPNVAQSQREIIKRLLAEEQAKGIPAAPDGNDQKMIREK